MEPTSVSSWSGNWAWSLPLIVLTVAIHSFGLRLVDRQVSLVLNGKVKIRLQRLASAIGLAWRSGCDTTLDI